MKVKSRTQSRQNRHRRLRRKIQGTADRPRMALMVSGTSIYVQFIDDDNDATLASVSSTKATGGKSVASATALGKKAVEAAGKAGISKVVIDRGGHKFHGRIKAVVDEIVKAGLSAGEVSEPAKPEADAEGKGDKKGKSEKKAEAGKKEDK
ncbi:hypothetical protein BVX97_00255 [bacterium E08(2017)]|nr:hypothetical protein BVX97_00255 [bacterium E08(2017)]